jgi:hypothetical protein
MIPHPVRLVARRPTSSKKKMTRVLISPPINQPNIQLLDIEGVCTSKDRRAE